MVAEAAVSSVIQLLGTVLIQKVNFLGDVKGSVELLKDELNRMQCFLRDANKKQAEDERVRNWIADIREVALDAKDAIDMFLLKMDKKSRLGKISSYPKHVHYLNNVGNEILSIQKRLDAIERSRALYGIRDLEEAGGSTAESRRRLPSWQIDEHLVGMDGDVRRILESSVLDEGRKGLSIVLVEGMGGIGKSTLARRIYNHPEVAAGGFGCRGWVVVSSTFDAKETMKQLILQVPRVEEEQRKLHDEMEMWTKDDKLWLQGKLEEELYKQLRGKKYFIVLDDVWDTEHLESLMRAFPDERDKASRLLITTRNKAIMKYSDYALEMSVLDPDESWELFLKKAFIHGSHSKCPEELEQIGREIVEKCNGLPLAISVAGGLLVETRTKNGWNEVLDQVNSHSGRAESSISTILDLSYQNLSPQLKLCFLCLASFKEDAIIPTKSLIHIWIGQGLIQEEGRRTVEEIARGYLNELINRNMVQIKDLTVDDRVKTCHLHDLFHDVCMVKAKEEVGFEIVRGGEGVESKSTSNKPRHRVFYGGGNLETLSLNENKHLRSLFVLKNVDGSLDDCENKHLCSLFGLKNVDGGLDDCVRTPFRFWKGLKMLETLYLEGVGLKRFPHSFRSLIGLRYLRIRGGSSEHLKIPSWFDNLKRLEVFDTRIEDVELPKEALKMEKLRFFRAVHVHGLICMESWRNIETLKYITLSEFMKCSQTLPSTCPIRELGLCFNEERESEKEMGRRARETLEKMNNLVKLHLIWDLSLYIEPSIFFDLSNLTRLKLRGQMKRCPSWSVFPPNLSHLTLVETFMDEDPMAELGRLPELAYLKLSGYVCLDERVKVVSGGFPSLKALSLKGMYFLKGIDVEEGAMPMLKLLSIRRCPALATSNLPEHVVVSMPIGN